MKALETALIGIVLLTCLFVNAGRAEERPNAAFRLWMQNAPGSQGSDDKDIPTLTPFWPMAETATGAAMIVCPGGGYSALAPHEGETYARWLTTLGISAFVLKYRLMKDGYHIPEILGDAGRAIRLVRSHAMEWKLDPKRVGIIGSSAGGHLAATLMTHFDAGKADAPDPVDRLGSRPDVVLLCYAFILFDRAGEAAHARFVGPTPTPEQVRYYSPALNIGASAPPCFLWQTVEDKLVPVENALVFAEALQKAGVPFDLHLYQNGGHGIGLGSKVIDEARLHPWTRDCAYWLSLHEFARLPK